MDILKPDLAVESLDEINIEYYRKLSMLGIILDLDNTIVPWDIDSITEVADRFIKKAKALNFKICLLSNAHQKRTAKIARQYQINFIAPAFKPRKKAFKKALRLIDLRADQVMVIGDQLFTDILGGNRAGCFTILVNPLTNREFIGTKILRFLEGLIKRRYEFGKNKD